MKLISRRIRLDPETKAPSMEITIVMPMQYAMDALCRTEEEFEAKLGKELVELIRLKDED